MIAITSWAPIQHVDRGKVVEHIGCDARWHQLTSLWASDQHYRPHRTAPFLCAGVAAAQSMCLREASGPPHASMQPPCRWHAHCICDGSEGKRMSRRTDCEGESQLNRRLVGNSTAAPGTNRSSYPARDSRAAPAMPRAAIDRCVGIAAASVSCGFASDRDQSTMAPQRSRRSGRSGLAAGSGPYPEQALTHLVDKLREVRGDPNG
jgi:hypothetical protein